MLKQTDLNELFPLEITQQDPRLGEHHFPLSVPEVINRYGHSELAKTVEAAREAYTAEHSKALFHEYENYINSIAHAALLADLGLGVDGQPVKRFAFTSEDQLRKADEEAWKRDPFNPSNKSRRGSVPTPSSGQLVRVRSQSDVSSSKPKQAKFKG